MSLRPQDVEAPARNDGQGKMPPPRPEDPPRRPRRRRLVAAAVAAALVAPGLVLVLRSSGSNGSAGGGGEAGGPRTSTAKVVRQDLVARTDVDGTLGYSGNHSVINQRQGTLTAVPEEGAVIERGRPLYRVDNQPVTLLYGDVPAWRDLSLGMADGPDVRQLEENLTALGHDPEGRITVDEHFTSATAAAIRRWQEALGVEQTGGVELGQVVFLPGAFRVASVQAEKGAAAAPGAPALTGTGTGRVVQVDLDAAKQSLAKVGEKVDVKLPGGATTAGTIATVGRAAQTKGQGESAKQVITVTVTLDDPQATGSLDQAPVKVGITSDSRRSVLAVPVNALLALAEGGYGVRVMDGRSTTGARVGAGASAGRPFAGRIVAVNTGLFARGMVEISGEGIAEGTAVEVPAS